MNEMAIRFKKVCKMAAKNQTIVNALEVYSKVTKIQNLNMYISGIKSVKMFGISYLKFC